jgi:probable HAF family extracellular repeat protein
LGAVTQAQAAVMYRVVDLGTLGGTSSTAYGINDLGQVVGAAFAQTPSGAALHAFRTAPNQPINPATDDLGTLGGHSSVGWAINNHGQVVGGSWLPGSPSSHAFRTAPNQPINPPTDDLGTLGGSMSQARGINDAGQVVGESRLAADNISHAFRTGPNQAINPATDDLGASAGLSFSDAWAINEVGQVAGRSSVGAYRTGANSAIDPQTDVLGTLGGARSGAYAINASGQVAGASEVALGTIRSHIFRTGPNQPINPATDDLGTHGEDDPVVWGMNDRGDIVGMMFTAQGDNEYAFVCLGSTVFDLNDRIDPASGWTLLEAYDINNLGQIVGVGEHDGVRRAFRLDPIPEPSGLVISMGGIGYVALARRQKRQRA